MSKNQELALPELDFFSQYGAVAGGGSTVITGKLLKFTKGEFTAGQEGDEVPEGTRLAVQMDTVLTGYVRWEGNRPVEQIMGPIAKGFQPPKRADLGHDDTAGWEVGTDGKKRDPWQFANQFVAKSTDKRGQVFTFVTNSKGGFGAVGRLCTAYSAGAREKPGHYPVIELSTDSYKHAEFGKTYIPKFTVVGWVPKFAAVVEEAQEEAPKKRIGKR